MDDLIQVLEECLHADFAESGTLWCSAIMEHLTISCKMSASAGCIDFVKNYLKFFFNLLGDLLVNLIDDCGIDEFEIGIIGR